MSIASRMTAKVRPLSDSIADFAVAAYAAWTVCCHAVMLARGNVYTLVWVTLAAALAALAAGALLLRRRCRTAPPAPVVPEPVLEPVPDPLSRRSTLLLFGLAACVIIPYSLIGNPIVLWASSLVYALIACAVALRSAPPARAQARGTTEVWQEGALYALALGCAFLALWAHRWRNDDCYYINLAVAMVDRPDLPLLAYNTIHAPVPDVLRAAEVFVPYRVHSFEALGGLISHLTGIEAISVIHLGLGGASAALIPLALARLFRLIDPQRWFFMLIAAMCLLLFEGSSGLGFANQALVRMFTGKSVLLSVGVPMLVHHGIAFGLEPSRRRFLALLGAQITCVGLSSTALWLAPLAAMLAVIVPLRLSAASLRTIGWGLLSCVYVLGLALWVRGQLLGGGSADAAEDGGAAAALAVHASAWKARVGLVNYWLHKIFQDDRVIEVSFALLLLAVPCARTALGRRYMALFGLALVLLFVNPYVAEFMRHNVLGAFTGQRGLWLAPLPAALAIVFTALIPVSGDRALRGPAIAATLLGLFLFCAFVPTRHVFTRANGVALRWPPGPRVPLAAFELGRRLSRELPRDQLVLAPEVVSWYLPTIHEHAYPVLANAKYLRSSAKDENRRKKLVKWVSKYDGEFGQEDRRRLRSGLDRYNVGAVVLTHEAAKTKGLKDVLEEAGFRRQKAGVPGYRLYLRAAGAAAQAGR